MLGGYYEVSAKDGTNIFRAFMDTSRMALAYVRSLPIKYRITHLIPTEKCSAPFNTKAGANWYHMPPAVELEQESQVRRT